MSDNPSAYLYGETPDRSLVATIRFATGSDWIDRLGEAVLINVQRNFRILLDDNRIFFTCIGYADWRAGTLYNLALGQARASAVKREMDRFFGSFPNYSGVAAFSVGESQANQSARTRAALAVDRQVAIHTTFSRIPIPPPPPPPDIVYPDVRRIIARSFYRMDAVNVMQEAGVSNEQVDNINSALTIGNRLASFENTWGSESRAPATKSVDSSYRVNRVTQSFRYWTSRDGAANFSEWSADLTYEWGYPRSHVRVEITREIESNKTFEASYVLRYFADKDPVLTPGDPD